MSASANQDNRDGGVADISATNFAHNILSVIAFYEVVVVEGAERFWNENLVLNRPEMNETVHLVPIAMK